MRDRRADPSPQRSGRLGLSRVGWWRWAAPAVLVGLLLGGWAPRSLASDAPAPLIDNRFPAVPNPFDVAAPAIFAEGRFAPPPEGITPPPETATAWPPLPKEAGFSPPPTFDAGVTATAFEDSRASWEARLQALEDKLRQAEAKAAAPTPIEPLKATVKWTGQLQIDAAWFTQSPTSIQAVGDLQDGMDFRRARLGAFGELGETFEYRIEVDFALSGRPRFLDMWLMSKDLPVINNFKVGHFFEPFSLERLTPNRFVTFMERSLPDAFAPARNNGLSAFGSYDEELGTWNVGAFRAFSDDFGDDIGDGGEWAFTGRTTRLLWYEDDGRRLLHLGAAYSFRGADDDAVRFAERPEIRMAATAEGSVPNFVDTGIIPAESVQLFGAEAAFNYGPFSMQSEYMYVPVSRVGTSSVAFHAWYLQAMYFLTGEHRPYRMSTGFFDRVMPRTYALQRPNTGGVPSGWGAWQVAVRWSHIDLNDDTVRGGVLNDLTFGLNWHLTPYSRVTWNYIHAMLDRDPVGRSNTDIFGMRFGFDF